ncbi:MAG: hypothetical protein ABSE45_09630 [Candidatus Acidiferrales bacterium]|jgi:hypothetical protein
MSTIGCNEFLNSLGDWMEGERPSAALAHVRDCVDCRALAGGLEAIQRTAPALALDDPAPSPRVWSAIRAQLEQEGLIRTGSRGWAQALGSWLDEIFVAVPRPALAGAYLAVLVAVAIAFSSPGGRRVNEARWIDRMETATQPLSAQLASAEQDAVSSLRVSDPSVTASLHQNLAIVDNDIALCEKSVREEPENEVARDYLYDAYQQKADLLAQMTDRGDDGP